MCSYWQEKDLSGAARRCGVFTAPWQDQPAELWYGGVKETDEEEGLVAWAMFNRLQG